MFGSLVIINSFGFLIPRLSPSHGALVAILKITVENTTKKHFEEYAENIPTEYKDVIGLLLKITKDQIQDLDQQIESLTFLRDSRKPLLQAYENLHLEAS